MSLRASSRLLLGCHVYTSEGRDARVIASLRDACAAQRGVVLASSFVDAPYHRSSYTLVSGSAEALAAAVVNVSRAALAAIDLSAHDASHPRLGAVDHISCHPVPEDLGWGREDIGKSSGGGSSQNSNSGNSSCSDGAAAERTASAAAAGPSGREEDAAALRAAASLARDIGGRLSSGRGALPVYLYGAAHPRGRRLADIRRSLGYFGATDAARHAWRGALAGSGDLSPFPPDLGPCAADARSGVLTLGAAPWIVNFNVPMETGDMAAARRVARAVSERGGGLSGVEAMALAHSPGVIEAVLQAIAAAAAREGLAPPRPGGAYVIGKLPGEVAAAARGAGL
ncbi:hypothetical protein Rsub_12570 [Raphidocelis subcapitata]|uniref:Formiminotransferase N-terminal subdomain domain-containing protein n=1 Tax=Raphidocelis subcapitata TaxID=307507 RepID=A0A2V0PQN1_9CHLO|nr:hypothetical protein Rsub_12570 [Raphidocelis subcapitata]|eukprot:GBF99817.1 hypothetical protein Rsub_12570 [Raphidocelis subcapitata]